MKNIFLFLGLTVFSSAFAQVQVEGGATPQEIAKANAISLLKLKIDEEKANFTIRHYVNLSTNDINDAWPVWDSRGDFYRTHIAPHVTKENLSYGAEDGPQSSIMLSKKPLVLARVSTEEQRATLSEVNIGLTDSSVKIDRKLFNYEVTTYEKVNKKRVEVKSLLPAIFKTTTGAKVKKQITPGGRKQTIVAYTQPGFYTPVMEQKVRVSEDFAGAVLHDYVYFNQGDALHRTRSSESDLGKKELIGTMEASGGCARLGSREAAFARAKIKAVGLSYSRVQVVETDDILACEDETGKKLKIYLASDRTSAVLVSAETNKPLFVGLRGQTSWLASSAGRRIVLSTLPEILETTVDEPAKIEISYLSLQDKSPFKAFGQDYSVTLQTQILSLNVNSKFKFEELSSSVKSKEVLSNSELSLNCTKSN